MEVEIISSKDNALFARKEVVAALTGFNATPSRLEVVEAFSKAAKANKDAIVIEKIEHKFGSKQAKVFARVYENPKKLAETEHGYFSKRGKAKEAKPAEEKK